VSGARTTGSPPAADEIASLPGVCEAETVAPRGVDREAPPELLIEVPHGATRAAHFQALRGRLRGDLPDDLIDFFFVNTDVGAPECARAVAAALAAAERPRSVLILRCLLPRTLVDCNRALTAGDADYARTGVTKGLPDYVTDPADVRLLSELHAAYRRVAERAFARVCGAGGGALTLHTYAPRSVTIERFDRGIGAALRAAYEPAAYATWPERPAVDLITEDEDGARLAPPALVRALREAYARIGVEVAENASYRLHPATMGYRYSARWPGRVLCLEINRALLADPFSPFEEMTIGAAKVDRMAAPIAEAWLNVGVKPGGSQRREAPT
jgi:N-formylglutamate amidohydrolase